MIDRFYWWQRGVVYQIYPRSFMDSNGDGVGDLAGIISRLDYLAWLGVDAIWLSPIFPSPMADFGYDVSDYTSIDSLFGTMDDFDRLLAAAHQLNIKIILDYVLNHTSDQHPWFVESRASRESPKRGWYLWADARPDGGPPNNWLSVFGGSAWAWDTATGQYYYHAYLKEQPDLNWRHPEVQAAMLDVLRFWLDRGVDGFRVDALRQVIKDQQLRDNPPNAAFHPSQGTYYSLLPLYTTDRPEVHDVIAMMRRVVDQYDQCVLIGELYLPVERLVAYYGVEGAGVHLPFNFNLMLTPWNVPDIVALIEAYEAALPVNGWPTWVLGNHDQPRIASRIGAAQARVAAMLLLTLRGTPTLYNGEEIGMQDVPIPPEYVYDPVELNQPGLGLGRDPERTPMQWDGSPNAGFSTVTPWLPLAADWPTHNVAVQAEDPSSMLQLYRRLLELRRTHPALAVGDYRTVDADQELLVYERRHEQQSVLVLLNFSLDSRHVHWPTPTTTGRVLLSTHLDRHDEVLHTTTVLRPHEGIVVLIEQPLP